MNEGCTNPADFCGLLERSKPPLFVAPTRRETPQTNLLQRETSRGLKAGHYRTHEALTFRFGKS